MLSYRRFSETLLSMTQNLWKKKWVKKYMCKVFVLRSLRGKDTRKKTGDAEKFTLNGSDSSEKAVSPYANEHLAEKYTILAPVAINCHKKN